MMNSFKNIILSILNKNNNEKILEDLKQYNLELDKVKEETSIKLNSFKYTCLNSVNLKDILDKNYEQININNFVKDEVLDNIHAANINPDRDGKIVEQLFISARNIQIIERNCKIFNKYVSVISDLKKFINELTLDYSNIKKPYFNFYKDKKGYPILFFCYIQPDEFLYKVNNFKVYGFYGEFKSLSKKDSYLEMDLSYDSPFSSTIQLKNIKLGNDKNSSRDDTALQYLIKNLIPEFNNILNEIYIKNDSSISKEFKINTISSNINFNEDDLSFYKRNGFTINEDTSYLSLK